MKKHRHAVSRRAKTRIVATLLIITIIGVVSIAAYADDSTRDDRINEVKRMRQAGANNGAASVRNRNFSSRRAC